MDAWIVRNLTPCRLVIKIPPETIIGMENGRLVLAPLEQLALQVKAPSASPFGRYAQQAREERCLDWQLEPPPNVRARWIGAILVGTFVSVALIVPLALMPDYRPQAIVVGVALLLASVLLIRRLNEPPISISNVTVTLARTLLVALLVLIAGAGLPLLAIYISTELASVDLSGWPPTRAAGPDAGVVLVGRTMQILTIGLLASLPALMYMQFDREKLSTLVDRWLHNIFRLDATLLTLADVDAKYGRRVEEFYNASLDPNRPHLDNRRRSRSPIVFATTLIAIGWILVLLNPGVSIPTEDFAARAYVKQLFTPAQNAIAFAFLGAYLFALQAVLRSYVRGDLRPKTYNNVSARIISAVIIGWLLEVVFSADSAPIYALAFFAGVVPETVLRRVWDLLWQGADKRPAGLRSNKSDHAQQDGTPEPYPLEERSPLSELDGIDIYDRTRLGEEGITSVQALVRHDFFDLTLSTRIPMARLIDWVDQSLLYQHVARSDRLHLRNIYGIRTATELLYAASELRSATPSAEHPSLLPKDQRSVRLKVICLSLEDDEWLPYVRTWRRSKQQKRPRTLHFGAAPTGLPPTSVEDVDAVRRSNGDTTRIAESHAG